MVYEKPIAIVYNPNSGKKTNIRPAIVKKLEEANVPYEFIETKKVGDTYHIGNELDFTKYSALVVVGGDVDVAAIDVGCGGDVVVAAIVVVGSAGDVVIVVGA